MEDEINQPNQPSKSLFFDKLFISITNKNLSILILLGIITFVIIIRFVNLNTTSQKKEISKDTEINITEIYPTPTITGFQKISTTSGQILNNPIIIMEDKEATVSIYAVSISPKKVVKILDIEKDNIEREWQRPNLIKSIQTSKNGHIAYSLQNNGDTSIFFWHEGSFKEIENVHSKFSLSPDGKFIISLIENIPDWSKVEYQWRTNNIWEASTNVEFYLISTLDETKPEFITEKELMTDIYDSFSGMVFVDWTDALNLNPLLQERVDLQLGGKYKNLYELNVSQKEINYKHPEAQKFLDDRKYLQESSNGRFLTYRNIDPACCGGLNYGNDQTYILDLHQQTEKVIFNEHERYNNSEHTHSEQHFTSNLLFSPENSLIAQSIESIFRSEEYELNTLFSILITDVNGNQKNLIEGYKLIAWHSNEEIIVKKIINETKKHFRDDRYESIDLININSGEIENIYQGIFNVAKLIDEIKVTTPEI